MKHSTKSIIPALLAVSGGLANTPAGAIELGDIRVQSTLGQPLRASIAYALGPNEYIANYCVSLQPSFANNGLPAVTRANVSVANGVISLTGASAIREPLMSVRLDISCPYTPKLSREYMLFIDPARPAQAPAAAAPAAAATSTVASAVATRPATSPVRRASSAASQAPIDATTSYRVQRGDSLSLIAQRIENRSIGLWSAVAQIFEANPDAFLNNDPNQLKAGSLLVIPDFGPQATFAEVPAASAAEAAAEAQAATTPDMPADSGLDYETAFADTVRNEPVAVAEPTLTETAAPALRVDDVIAEDDTRSLQPGDVVLDTTIDVPATASNPNVATANIITETKTGETTVNWLWWLVGVGIALIVGLLAFGRRSPESAAPAAIAAHPMRRATDGNTEELEAIPDPFCEIEDDSPTEENLALDANLDIGTGLQAGTDVDVAQDFGFAATTGTGLDLEFPDESNVEPDSPQSNIVAPPSVEPSSILEREMLPDDDDYDMSVIVDATKMPVPEEVTERDLKAVVVDTGDETLISDNYTVSKEVDYDILEQDYEDEMTATQALNVEIERAATEIAEGTESEDNENDDNIDEETSQMPLATVTEIDVTANLQAADADDNTAILGEEKTEEILADEKTVEMPASNGKKTG